MNVRFTLIEKQQEIGYSLERNDTLFKTETDLISCRIKTGYLLVSSK